MKQFLTLLLTTWILLPTSRAWADNYWELYEAKVCNTGQITVDVATASKDFLPGEYWVIDRWFEVPPRECKVVFSHSYAAQSWLNFRSYPVHLAFAFTDATGVWGAAKVSPPSGTAASHLRLCVRKDNWKYKVDAADPATQCAHEPASFLIPASIDWEPTQGTKVCSYYSAYDCHSAAPKFTVALGPNDRAIPLGPRASTAGTPVGPGTSDEFHGLLKSTMDVLPESERTFGPGGYEDLKPGYRWVFTCIDKSVVSKESLSNLKTARAKALADAIRTFLAAHDKGLIRFRVTELNDAIAVAQIGGKTGDCANNGEDEYVFQSRATGDTPGRPPLPSAPPATQPSTTSGGFGDLVSPGVITPPKQ